MRKKRILAAGLALVVLVLTAGLWAYFSAQGRADSVITLGSVHLALHDETGSGQPFPDTAVTPGESLDKLIYVENTGTGAFFTRIKLELTAVDAAGAPARVPSGFLTLDLNRADWTAGTDGYFYYNGTVAPGAASTPLCRRMQFTRDMGDAQQGMQLSLRLTAEAVQTSHLEQYAAGADTSGVWQHAGAVESSAAGTRIDTLPAAEGGAAG